jgi:hypothetical protein
LIGASARRSITLESRALRGRIFLVLIGIQWRFGVNGHSRTGRRD